MMVVRYNMVFNDSVYNASTSATNLSLEQLTEDFIQLQHDSNDMFVVFCAIITSFMQIGFAALEAGCINSKNVTNIILKNVLDTFICGLGYWTIGYSLAYSDGNAYFGYSGWFGRGLTPDKYSFWVFEFIFASTASTILSGAVAERCSFITYMSYSSIISGFVYPVASHWAWAKGGWLEELHYLDLAGCGAVHALGGSASMVAAIFMGPRIGRFKDGKPVDKPGHSMALVGIGVLLLFSGFLGFNAGALGGIFKNGHTLGLVIQNTVLGGSGAVLVILVLCRLGVVGEPKWAFGITVNAVLAGLVAVCGAVNYYTPVMALVTGIGGCLNFILVRYIVLRLQVDDPLDAVAVHFGGGSFGLIAGPLFVPQGIFFGINESSVKQLVHNIIGGTAIVSWSVFCSIIMFGSLKFCGLLRVSEEEEIRGLDISKHKEPAYPVQGWAIDYPIECHYTTGLKKNGSYTLDRGGNDQIFMVGPQFSKINPQNSLE